jgi:Glutamine synthetase, beta-Grasp domain
MIFGDLIHNDARGASRLSQVLDLSVAANGTLAALPKSPGLAGPPYTLARTQMTPADVLKLIKEKDAKFVDLRFTDTIGKEQHVTIPTRLVDEGFFKDGKMFDGSSIAGWKGINESDMILMPDPSTAVLDPFYEEATLNLRCDVIEPMTMQGYGRDPRSLAKRCEAHLKA